MKLLSPKLQIVEDSESRYDEYLIWCPACDEWHSFRTLKPGKDAIPGIATWAFNGNAESPTFQPSLRYLTGTKCHLTLTNGIIEFHADCPHKMAESKVQLPDIPKEML